MIRFCKSINKIAAIIIALGVVMVLVPQSAQADAGFRKWIKGFSAVARRRGITRSTYNKAFKGIRSIDSEVLALARFQPEFRQKLWMYFDTRVSDRTVARGRQEKRNWGKWLTRIERKYGVSANILLAIWSMESGYGEAMKKPKSLRSVIRSLATLAYADRRRRKFARSQLIASLKILQSGRITTKQLRGSWAGAMGHTQFIPTSYIAYRQDMDGDGRKDIWASVPDALATAANLLKRNGWRTGQSWGYEVSVSNRAMKHVGRSRTIGSWAKLGVRRVAGRKFRSSKQRAVLKFPAGRSGPAFLLLKNFFVIKRYNNSDKYALAVGHLADQIGGSGEFARAVPRPFPKLSYEQRIELQKRLSRMGLYDSDIDGKIGSGTRAAIRKAQRKMGLNPTGFESPKFLSRLRKQG